MVVVRTAQAKQRYMYGQVRDQSQFLRVRRPARNGGRGYDLSHRQETLVYRAARLPVFASRASVFRWRNRIDAYERTGNKQVVSLSGIHQFHLLFYRAAYPKANADEVRRWMFENSPPNSSIIFSRQQITRAEIRMRLSHKRSSTTALQASEPRNLVRRYLFWNRPYPLGRVGIPIVDLLDYDEAAFFLETANRKEGKAYVGVRVREEGPYGHSQKWTLKLCVGPGVFKHFAFTKEAGTSKAAFRLFISSMLPRLAVGPQRTILMDNLESHYDAATWINVAAAGHRFLPRTPYYPVDGPIEYVFNTIGCALRQRLYRIRTEADLQREMLNIITGLPAMRNYFVHCGY
jgi:transposase